jgi:Arc/MetJ-type ribon-helix-helix transcriptional regulator
MSTRRVTIRFDPEQIDGAEEAVEAGEYQNISEFVREAVAEKVSREEWHKVGERRIQSDRASMPSE